MAKKKKEYDITLVFDVIHETEKPISASMLGKIRKNDLVNNMEILSDKRIRVYRFERLPIATDIDGIDKKTELWGEEIEKMLHSCSRFLIIRKISVFIVEV